MGTPMDGQVASPVGSATATPGGEQPGAEATPTGEQPATAAAGPADALALAASELPATRMYRLTESELTHSLQDILGPDVPIGELEPNVRMQGFSSIGAGSVFVSPAGVDLHEQAVLAALEYLFADAGRLESQLPCVPESTADAACLEQVVTSVGRRAFRRLLTAEEVQRFTDLATTIGNSEGSDVETGMRHALSAILQSPSFIYRVELGAPSDADGGRIKFTDFEMAGRLAAMFWDTVPDDELLDAAAAGELASVDGIRAHAERLLADPKAERAVAVFVDELFDLHRLDAAIKDPELFPTWDDSLKEAMRQELELRVVDMVFTQKGDFLSLYDGRQTFVNDELASFYGLPESGQAGFYPAEFPAESNRAGLLGAAAILAGHALPQRTSPTARGRFVTESLLCIVPPPPPDNVPPLPPRDQNATLREQLDMHRADPACAACHALMDPMGFGMEDFDAVGLHRTMDGVKPVDATGQLVGPGLDGSTFDGLAELGAALRKQPILSPCLVSKVYAEALGRPALALDRGTLNALTTAFGDSQNRFDQLLISLATSESFRFLEPEG